MKKSTNLYAIRVIPLSTKREKQLSDLLNREYENDDTKYYIGAHGGSSIFYSPKLGYVKKWKTIKGCENYLNRIVLKTIKSHYTQSFEKINEDWRNPIFEVVNINREWNDHIDNQIKNEFERHSVSIERLEKLKLK